MQVIKYGVILIFLLILQGIVLPYVFNSWPVPNLLLLFVLILAVLKDEAGESLFRLSADDVLIIALVSGLFVDGVSSGWFGFYTIFFLVLALLTMFMTDKWIEPGLNYQTWVLIALILTIVFPYLSNFVLNNSFSSSAFLSSLIVNLLVLLPLILLRYVRAR